MGARSVPGVRRARVLGATGGCGPGPERPEVEVASERELLGDEDRAPMNSAGAATDTTAAVTPR
jgi:hypothetical protein